MLSKVRQAVAKALVLLWAGLLCATAEAPAAQPAAAETQAIAELKALGGRFLAEGRKASWSPDGRRIVFGTSGGLKILDLGSGKTGDLVKPGRCPAWSPGDGRWIAYVVGEGPGSQVWLVAPGGGPARKLAAGDMPGWSSDGKTVFVQSPDHAKIQAFSLDSRDAAGRDVLPGPCRCASVFPDGLRVAYRGDHQLVVADAKTGQRLHTWPLRGNGDCELGWSPDGKLLGFGNVAGRDFTGLWVWDLPSRRAVRVAAGPCSLPAWSADGSKLALDLSRGARNEVWVLETRQLRACPPWATSREDCTVPAASPEAVAELVGPWHQPRGPLHYVDLRRQANWKLDEGAGKLAGNDLKGLPRGEQGFAGVKFRIADSAVQLAGGKYTGASAKVEGIPIQRRVIRLYVLHGTLFSGSRHRVGEGTVVGRYQVRYADGSEAVIPVVQGEDIRDWWAHDGGQPVARGQVAWVGRNAAADKTGNYLRIYLLAWDSPYPEKIVASINYLSEMTPAAPFCIAMTVEGPGPAEVPSNRASKPAL